MGSAKEIGRSIQSQRQQVKKTAANLKIKMEQEIAGVLGEKVVGF